MQRYIFTMINHAGNAYVLTISGDSLEHALERVREEDTNTIFQIQLFR